MASERIAIARLPPIGPIPRNTKKGINKKPKYDGLNGPNYQMNGSKYNLPEPNSLKPYVDTNAGSLETWPAHATGQIGSGTSVGLTKNKDLVVIDDEDLGKPQIIPKPRFLEQLESFLKKEIRSLGVVDVSPSELRLQAHREVFEYLIEDFKTYKPILSAIKNEYEMFVAHQREQLRQMEPLRQMLVTVSEQCDQKIMALRDQEKQDMVDLKKENSTLFKRISDMKNEQKDLQSQVAKLQEELAAEYLKYRDECDARKLLVSDINDLRYQQEDIAMAKQGMKELEEEEIDPVTMRIALKKAREDEASASRRLNEMVANYGDVIPRRDFESLEKKHIALEETLETLRKDFGILEQEHASLLDVHKQVTQQRDEFYAECETLRRSATPRPDWEKCADHVTKWKDLSENKTSNQLVDVLLNEIAGGSMGAADATENFEGRGTEEGVPEHLRFEGEVRNRKIAKRDCALLVQDIWKEKLESDNQCTDGTRRSMPDFVAQYLKRIFGLEQMVIEWGYNLHDACERYAHDERLGTFYGILTGDVDEEVYHSQVNMMSQLADHLKKTDNENGGQNFLTKDNFKTALQQFFPDTNEETVTAFIQAAEQELDAKEMENIEYLNLFMVDDEGRTGLFLDEIKKQLRQDRMNYIDEIKIELANVSQGDRVEPNDVKRAITSVDPEIDSQQLDAYLSWAFKCKKDEIDQAEGGDIEQICERLRNGNIKRIGKKLTP
ncbi:translin-associated factor X-interacting protein 1-like [Tubulanus polymorphus]|uniref:translin-associated factor X-interacting protein 1-like n=1 Tax=Tubulanus polymorphus TaxID=672921 RepID=UPI003DA64AE7